MGTNVQTPEESSFGAVAAAVCVLHTQDGNLREFEVRLRCTPRVLLALARIDVCMAVKFCACFV